MITPITTECNDLVASLDSSSDLCYTYSMKVRDGQSLTVTPFLYTNGASIKDTCSTTTSNESFISYKE